MTRRELRALEHLEQRDAAALRAWRAPHASWARARALRDVLLANVRTLEDLETHARVEVLRRMHRLR